MALCWKFTEFVSSSRVAASASHVSCHFFPLRRERSKLGERKVMRMEAHLKKEWEKFVLDQVQASFVKQFGKLKTDRERFIFCKNILR